MSRPLRIQYPDAWYNVMNCGRRSEPIFTGKNDFDTLKAVGKAFRIDKNSRQRCRKSNTGVGKG